MEICVAGKDVQSADRSTAGDEMKISESVTLVTLLIYTNNRYRNKELKVDKQYGRTDAWVFTSKNEKCNKTWLPT